MQSHNQKPTISPRFRVANLLVAGGDASARQSSPASRPGAGMGTVGTVDVQIGAGGFSRIEEIQDIPSGSLW